MIELSFDIIKTKNFICLKNNIIELANKYDKTFMYNNHEIMAKNRIIFRNHYVITILFEYNDKKVSKFIKEIKKNYKKINIESISYDNCVLKMMYASKKYLNFMDKYKAKEYLEKRRNNTLFGADSFIMKEMNKKY